MNFEKKLREGLHPLYDQLLSSGIDRDNCVFCAQWGKNYPENQREGILFVGKAVNGWLADGHDVDVLFNSAFNREDQMVWVQNLEGVTVTADGKPAYNTKKSSFWRTIKRIALGCRPDSEDNWTSYIAWSNLYKVSPGEGNPGGVLKGKQSGYCKEILAKEIEILSPKYIVFLTSGWESDFLCYLNKNQPPQKIGEEAWGGYKSELYKIDGVYYIASYHPQSKSESEHADAILKLMHYSDNK